MERIFFTGRLNNFPIELKNKVEEEFTKKSFCSVWQGIKHKASSNTTPTHNLGWQAKETNNRSPSIQRRW